jgi:hypothetical protein
VAISLAIEFLIDANIMNIVSSQFADQPNELEFHRSKMKQGLIPSTEAVLQIGSEP